VAQIIPNYAWVDEKINAHVTTIAQSLGMLLSTSMVASSHTPLQLNYTLLKYAKLGVKRDLATLDDSYPSDELTALSVDNGT